MSDPPTLEAQQEAFEDYKSAKLKLDETLTFEDAKAAREAWWKFLHVFEANTAEPRET